MYQSKAVVLCVPEGSLTSLERTTGNKAFIC